MTSLDHGLAPKMKPVSPRRSAVVCGLDIGTSKVACMIARLTPRSPQEVLHRRSHAVEVLGLGHAQARGMKAGTVVDLVEAEAAVRQAVDAAERMAGVHIESVVLAVSAGRMASELYAATVHLRGSTANEADIERVLAAGSRHSVRDGRAVLHSLPIGFALDDARSIRDPRGMRGRRLGVDMHVVTVDAAATRNLMLAVERCHLAVEAMVATPYVTAHSVLADGFALGGNHITMDLARGLNARIADAERIKTLHGSAICGPSDDRDMISVTPVGEHAGEPPQLVPRAALTRIIAPRAEEILEMVRDRLASSPFAADPRGPVVLAGGSSQLAGLPEVAARILGRQVRVGRPLGIGGLPDIA